MSTKNMLIILTMIQLAAIVFAADNEIILKTDFTDTPIINMSNTTTTVSGNHNDLSGLQGGSSNEYYHLNNSIYTYLLDNIYNFSTNGSGSPGNALLQDGSTPLTANWNQGTFNLSNVDSWFFGWVFWDKISNKPDTLNTTTTFNGEVSGTYDNIVVDNNALDDQYIRNNSDAYLNNINITYNLTVNGYQCYNADCSAYIYWNGSSLVGVG